MFVFPANSNSVHIPLIQMGCLKSEFDSTYPIYLNGIIKQDEFQQSIKNINQTISSRKFLIICGLIFLLCILGGMVLFIVGGITAAYSRKHGFPLLIGIGFGMLFFIFVCFMVQLRRRTRMQQAIAKESMKYSMRSPIPCSWRLDVSRTWNGGYGRRGIRLVYRLVIEIGNPVAPGNGKIPYQFNQVTPPPYYDQSAIGFCSQCDMPRQNHTAKFCLSCGQSFNK